MSPTRTPQDWREFERLVARIEAAAAPLGATVRSPDRIVSIITGRKREVDASIRLRVGTADVLVTIECRKRRPKEDVTWIEQLGSKKQAIGASRTIAVSVTGFSSGAEKAAAFYGIDLRRLSEITTSEISGWLGPQFMAHVYKQAQLHRVQLQYLLEGAHDEVPVLRSDAAAALSERGADAPILVQISDGRPVSLNTIWLQAEAQGDFYSDIPKGGAGVRKTIRIAFERGLVGVPTERGTCELAALLLTVDLCYAIEEIPLAEARIVEYANADVPLLRRAEFLTKGARRNLRIGIQSTALSGEFALSAEFVERSRARERERERPGRLVE